MKNIFILLAALSLVGCDMPQAPETYYTITAGGTTNVWHHVPDSKIDRWCEGTAGEITFTTEDGRKVTLTHYILETEN